MTASRFLSSREVVQAVRGVQLQQAQQHVPNRAPFVGGLRLDLFPQFQVNVPQVVGRHRLSILRKNGVVVASGSSRDDQDDRRTPSALKSTLDRVVIPALLDRWKKEQQAAKEKAS